MAETEENETEEIQEENPQKSPLMKMIFLSIVILLFLGGGFFVWKAGLLQKLFGGNDEMALAAKNPGMSESDIGPMFPLSTFIVNLVDPLGKKYLKVVVELELDDVKLTEEIKMRLPQIRDTVITLLSAKTFEDVSQLEGKFQLRAEMLTMLNKNIKSGKIRRIYFTEFIVQ
ncbi:flagellar basal body-associated protein FliL [Thermodesulfobacteriota bacterium]